MVKEVNGLINVKDSNGDINIIKPITEIANVIGLEDALIATPEQYGAVGDGVTDDSDAIQEMFDTVKTGAIVFGNNKIYKVTKEIIIHSGYATLTVLLGSIKYAGLKNNAIAVIRINNDVTDKTYGEGSVRLFGGSIDCNKLAGTGIRNYNAYHTVINSVKINNYNVYGIDNGHDDFRKIEGGKSLALSTQIMIANCYINNYGYGSIGTAIRLVHPDNNISNCVINECEVGIEFTYGGNFISNTHFTPSSTAMQKAEDAKYKFIVNNPIEPGAVQMNSFSNCYFNGTRIKYIHYNNLNNSLITALNDCSVILGTTSVVHKSYLQNSLYSPLQISNIKVRKSSTHTLYGTVHVTGDAQILQRSTLSVDNSAEKTQLYGDINNMDTSATTFAEWVNIIPSHTMRRIATVFEPGNLPSGSSFKVNIGGKTNIEITTSRNNTSLKYITGVANNKYKIFKDKETKVVDIGDEYQLRAYDIYIYNDSDEDATDLCVISSDNASYPVCQVAIYRGNTDDFEPSDFENYAEITETQDLFAAENLLKYPSYYSSDNWHYSGVESNVNADGILTLNGTAEEATVVYRFVYPRYNSIPLEHKRYVFNSHAPFVSGAIRCDIGLALSDGSEEPEVINGTTSTIINIDNTSGKYKSIDYISVYATPDYTLNKFIMKPMLEEGDISHDFVPYKYSRQSLRDDINVRELYDMQKNIGLSSPVSSIINDDDTVFINYDNGSGNVTAYNTMSRIYLKDLNCDKIYIWINKLSGTISLKWLGYNIGLKDLNDEVIRTDFKSVSTTDNGIYLIAVYNVSELIEQGVSYIRIVPWISANNKYKDVLLKVSVTDTPVSPANIPYKYSEKNMEYAIDSSVGENLISKIASIPTIAGTTAIVDDDGIITITKSDTSAQLRYQLTERVPVEVGAYYTISFGFKCANITDDFIFIENFNATTGSRASAVEIFGKTELTFVATHPYIDVVYLSRENSALNNRVIKLMLEKGTIAHEFQPYKLSRKSMRDDIDALIALSL